MSEFSDRPFVAGSLTGLRAFDVDSLGRLRGVTVSAVMKPGENVAHCHKSQTSLAAQMARIERVMHTSIFGGALPAVAAIAPPPDSTAKDHTVAGVSCSCGYYAYYDRKHNPHDGPSRVTALIEGYGVCSVGTRGFRAEKARLLALVNPTRRRSLWSWVGDWRVFIFLGIVSALSGVLQAFQRDWVWLGVMTAFVASDVVFGVQDFRSQRKAKAKAPRWDLIRRAYPDVPVYNSLRAALADHPLTPPPAPTPDDEDFWTRSAS